MHTIESQIIAVTVYPDRARITRQGKATLQPGMQILELPDVPLRIIPDSVRATARGTAQARLMGVQVQRTFFTETPQEQIRELEGQIESISDQIKSLETRAASIEDNRIAVTALLAETNTYAIALSSGETDIESQLKLFDHLRARSDQLAEENQAISIQKREAERQLQKLQNELNLRRKSPRREQYTARVELEVLQAGDLQVDLTYLVLNAGWQPLYDLRLTQQGDNPARLEVAYLAQITQTTGEDWQDVALTLSTARPALSSAIPKLDPWYIRPLPPPQERARSVRFSKAPGDMDEVAAMPMAVTPAAMEAPIEEAFVAVDDSGAAVTYQVPGKATVPADGAPHQVVVTRIDLKPELDYVSAPRLVQAVYRRAKLANESRYTLLPGKANLYSGEEYIGGTTLELTAPNGEIELYLGVDDRIKVERELKRRDVDKRLLGGKRRLQYGYQIEIENARPNQIHLMIQDQIPVSGHEDLKVKLENAAPKPDRQTELNLLEWDLILPSKTRQTLRFDFSVEYPQDLTVVGLP
jgi:uncharacterized protein (TIGR02231 family)